jgi:hypothetical protein
MESSANEQPSSETKRAREATDGLQEAIEEARSDDVETLAAESARIAGEAREAALRAAGGTPRPSAPIGPRSRRRSGSPRPRRATRRSSRRAAQSFARAPRRRSRRRSRR